MKFNECKKSHPHAVLSVNEWNFKFPLGQNSWKILRKIHQNFLLKKKVLRITAIARESATEKNYKSTFTFFLKYQTCRKKMSVCFFINRQTDRTRRDIIDEIKVYIFIALWISGPIIGLAVQPTCIFYDDTILWPWGFETLQTNAISDDWPQSRWFSFLPSSSNDPWNSKIQFHSKICWYEKKREAVCGNMKN